MWLTCVAPWLPRKKPNKNLKEKNFYSSTSRKTRLSQTKIIRDCCSRSTLCRWHSILSNSEWIDRPTQMRFIKSLSSSATGSWLPMQGTISRINCKCMMILISSWGTLRSIMWRLCLYMRYLKITGSFWRLMSPNTLGVWYTLVRKLHWTSRRRLCISSYWKYSAGMKINLLRTIRWKSSCRWLLIPQEVTSFTCSKQKGLKKSRNLSTLVLKLNTEKNRYTTILITLKI